MDEIFKKYLSKIGKNLNSFKPNLELLSLLQKSHIETIPWENLDLYFNKKIVLDLNYILEKYLEYNRGGICFELNYSYYKLLREIGFEVKLVQATIYAFNEKIYNTPRNTHIVTLVNISDKIYLSDVSWNGFRSPLKLPMDVCTDVTGTNRVLKSQSNSYNLEKLINNLWIKQYSFSVNEISITDIIPLLDYSSASQEREVAHHLMIIKHLPNGILTIVDDEYKKIIGKNYDKFRLKNLIDLKKFLLEDFGINYNINL